MTLPAGTRLGPYEVTGQVGAGGMGEVYRAIDTTLGREVAIKTLHSAFATDADRLARFEREARLLAALNHAHIASIYGLHEHDGARFLSMELVRGETLQEKLKSGALPVEEALTIALQIAEALEAAHDKGIVHRDLKPANVMIARDGVVKVLDFGLAKAFSLGASEVSSGKSPPLAIDMTQQGVMVGTAGYMSPEQASGQATDQRTDIWAFGVVLYEMLTGLPPFAGETTQHVVADVLKSEPRWSRLPAKLHPLIRLLLERCLEKKPRSRYHAIADARLDIERALSDPEHALLAPVVLPMRSASSMLAGGLVVAVVGGVLLWFLTRDASEVSPSPTRYSITPPEAAPLANVASDDIAISADGTRVVYVARDLAGNFNSLYLREKHSLATRQIPGTEIPRGGAFNPFFSPNGKEIGFGSGEQGILRVDIASGVSRKIVDYPGGFRGAAWTADDTLIYSARNGLYRVPVDSSAMPVEILNVVSNRIGPPRLLPGERTVLLSYRDEAKETQDIVVVDLKTGKLEPIIENGTDPFYTPTGHLVFVRGSTLMAAPFDLDLLAVTGDAVAIATDTGDALQALDLAISENGTLVYAPATVDSGMALVWLDDDGRVIGRAVDDLLEDPRGVRVSPNGTQLAVVTGPMGEGKLWIYDLVGGRQGLPLADEADNRGPVWSPESKRVAFASNRGGNYQTYVLPADNSVREPRLLGPYGRLAFPNDWLMTPGSASDELILNVERESRDIVATSLGSLEAPDVVVATVDEEVSATVSPDGQWLVFISDRTGEPEIWAKRYPDGTPQRLHPGGAREPVWSLDGRQLFFLQGREMMSIAVATEGEFPFADAERLFTVSEDLVIRGTNQPSYDVDGEGRFLMAQESAATGDEVRDSLIVVQNWFEELKEQVPSE